MGEHFVGTVADEDLLWAHAMVRGDAALQITCVRIGVQPQAIVGRGLDGPHSLRCRSIRVFVRVPLHEAGPRRLLACHIGLQCADVRAPEAAPALALMVCLVKGGPMEGATKKRLAAPWCASCWVVRLNSTYGAGHEQAADTTAPQRSHGGGGT